MRVLNEHIMLSEFLDNCHALALHLNMVKWVAIHNLLIQALLEGGY
jgi:hypothetical protein